MKYFRMCKPCRLAITDRCFEWPFETSVGTYKSARQNISEDFNL